jgi:diaminopimelate epimerase
MTTKRASEFLTLYKMSGAGNDFLFADLFDARARARVSMLSKTLGRPALARKLCRRHESVGADGLIFIEPAADFDFRWDFYNSDGSAAEMCGNAGRCAVRFAREILGIKKPAVRFQTSAGEVRGRTAGALRARVFLPAPKIHHEGLTIQAGGRKWTGTFIHAGVPHFVTEAKFKTTADLDKSQARAIQTHRIFGPRRTNVTFIEVIKKNRLRAVTFERGVHDFTLACGTGAVAAAFALAEKTKLQSTVFVEMPGGELNVSSDNRGKTALEGEARMVGKIALSKESLYG